MWVGFQIVGSFLDKDSPGAVGRFHTESKVGKRCFIHDETGYGKGGINNGRAEGVGNDVPEEHAQSGQAEGSGCFDKFPFL